MQSAKCKILGFFIIVLIFSFFILNSPVLAQSPTPSSIRDSVKQQVDQELSQIKNNVSKKGFVGTISAKSDGTITISNLQSQTRTALVSTDAIIKLTGGKDGTPADLKVADF